MVNSSSSHATNIIENHDFCGGLQSWHPNCCEGFIISADSGHPQAKSAANYAVVTNRKECWQGLEQDITGRISPGSTYLVSASVGVSGPLEGCVDVLATLKMEYQGLATKYSMVGR